MCLSQPAHENYSHKQENVALTKEWIIPMYHKNNRNRLPGNPQWADKTQIEVEEQNNKEMEVFTPLIT